MQHIKMELLQQSKEETSSVNESLVRDHSPDAFQYIQNQIDLGYDQVHVLATSTRFNVENVSVGTLGNLVNLKRVNDTRFVNKFFEAANAKLNIGGLYIGCFESMEQRKERIFKKFPFLFAYLYYVLDFLWKRVIPKLKVSKRAYFALTKGHNRVLSLPEVLGRLVCCGFEIVDYTERNGKTYFTARKTQFPTFDNDPTYGPLICLNRVGFKGKHINVYKIRTMHPYSEYLQEFIYKQNDLQNGGKFRDDFRITRWGKCMRKLWLDELPMVYNLLKGDLKLVGVRPLSNQYFSLYPENFRQRRSNYKPGLVPPFYADLPETLEEIMASEKKYMMEYDKSPFLTDVKYFFKSVANILFKKARSN